MCGITGYLNLKKGIRLDVVHAMNDIIKHRGPDDEGYAVFGDGIVEMKGQNTIREFDDYPDIRSTENRSGYLAFGHRRLSIIDISPTGHQPMRDSSERYWVVFNGEIYNYIEIRQELRNAGHNFRTNSDTEVVLEAYKEWGENCVLHFNGMWAFSIYDMDLKVLFCSRDRLGAKPFYYVLNEQKFMFGSEIKQLCQDPDFEAYMNENMLMNVILFRISDFGEETLIQGIQSLPGGYNLCLHLNMEKKIIDNIRKYQYWDLKKGTTTDNDGEEWYSLIKDSIRLRLRSDAPVGAMVSGGVDSSFLVAEICDYYKSQGRDVSRFQTFTSCYHNSERHDETKYAHMVNESCGVEEHLIFPESKASFEAFKKMIWHFEGYCTFSNLGSFLTLEQIAKTGVKVLINGQGGDESMFGYERYYAYYFLHLLKKGKIRECLSEYKKASEHSRLSIAELAKYLVYFGSPLIRKLKNQTSAMQYVNNDLMKRYDYNSVKHILEIHNMDELIYNELRETQLTHILRYDDRGYMAYSMESRVPFIDYRYLENAININPRLKIQNGYTKYLVRKKMEQHLPQEVVWRTNKNGWSSPAERWVSGFTKQELDDVFEHAISESYFDVDKIKKLYLENSTCKAFETFLVIELFMRQFHVKPCNEKG